MAGQQRRCSLRAHILNSISMIDSEGDLLFDVKDVSEGGAFIYSDLLMDVGEEVSLSFELPQIHHVVETKAIIIRSEKNEDKGTLPGMAVRFTTISKEDSQAISDYILKYLNGYLDD